MRPAFGFDMYHGRMSGGPLRDSADDRRVQSLAVDRSKHLDGRPRRWHGGRKQGRVSFGDSNGHHLPAPHTVVDSPDVQRRGPPLLTELVQKTFWRERC